MTDILTAFDMFVSAADDLGPVTTFQFDLVDLTRQVLANSTPIWYERVTQAYRDIGRIHENGLVFTDLLKDLDKILSTNSNFMMGPWLESVKNMSSNENEKD